VDAWQAGIFYGGTGQINLAATAGGYSQIGELGMYADPNNTGIAPPWETPDEAEQLPLCQRYYLKTGYNIWNGNTNNGSAYSLCYALPAEMRATPAVSGGANQSNTNFPAGPGTLVGIDTKTVRETRTANASAAVGAFASSTIVCNARL